MPFAPWNAPSAAGRRGRGPLVLLLLLGVLTVGGRDGRASTPSPTADPAAVEILARASERIADTEAVHFTLDIEGETFIDDGETIQLLEAEGDLARPDRVRTTFKIKVSLATLTIELITIGDEAWSTNFVTGDWGPAPAEFGYSPAILFDTQEGIGPVMGKVTAPRLLDDEEIDDRPAHHVAGVVERDIIDPITGGTMDGSSVAVDLWIDRETDDLLRARLAEPETDEDDDPATWTLDLSDHGKTVTIEPPD